MPLTLSDPTLLKHQAYINGEWVDADDGATFAVTNPATGEVITEIARVGAAETARAIAAADTAMADWKKVPAKARAQVLRKWFDLMMEHQEDLAQLMTAEQGKVIAESRGEIAYGAAFIEWFGEEAKRIDGDVIPGPSSDKRIVCIKQPVGVVAAITPWNFPNAMIARKAAPALAAGCSIVIKPASETPLSALAMAELAERAGVPAGVVNVVAGSASKIGAEITSNPTVRKLTFTGSTPIGKMLVEQCAPTMKKTSMELGGNAPFIVFDDADIDSAITGAMISKYRNAGQTCVCSNRIFVQDGVYDEFVAKFVKATAELTVGNGADDGVVIGPLVTEKAMNDVDKLVQESIAQGAQVAAGGSAHSLGGSFYQPTVLTEVTSDMAVFRNEIFGPVSPVVRFSTEEEVIAMANDTEFGLASYFYTRDIGRVWRIAEALDYGIVGINEGIISNEMAPFGGVKESGSGREGSKYGIDDYVEIKYMLMGGLDA
ncbi:succinate-semialdehyde dehydrogenase (NADP(+)) [Halioglobus japonicus]|uniref:NAD-dependent succinate-semialdehyde dehydrogenase n=1 Tax=Halioglobus japonicus TaxID=930805 RepID=A0AAP8SPL4_9GAMM|nr:NAD-dependent succinate-semialdehyde dehydrogenase [Halioglobus japonicus]AQA19643.1 succinate-semialdehyde dehydrogenase (NADP(+)) [Halioglobus japonicus]PLW87288.1 NAD-dependent succinate-semialdehyde dehydrogenase [Halioglobus japonicus]GHD09197.1 glutarate-semialdehyde dehydrogenase DavD [Halioglobus japonicus]